MSYLGNVRASDSIIRSMTAAQWTAGNYEMLSGELGIESDTGKQKAGNGNRWNNTDYLSGMDEPPSDSIIYGRRNETWVDLTSPANLQVNRGTASEVSAYVALAGEPVYDATSKALHVGDGTTAGGALIGAKSTVSGGGPGVDYTVPDDAYVGTTSATIGPTGSVWRLTGYLRFEGDSESNAPRINVGTGYSGDSVILGGHYTATNTNGSVVAGLIRDASDEIDLTAATDGVWSVRAEIIIRVLEQATVAVAITSTMGTANGTTSLTWDLLTAERIA